MCCHHRIVEDTYFVKSAGLFNRSSPSSLTFNVTSSDGFPQDSYMKTLFSADVFSTVELKGFYQRYVII